MITKKYYIQIAKMIKESEGNMDFFIKELCVFFKKDNFNFDIQKFLDAIK